MEFTNTGGAPSKRLTGIGIVLLVHVVVIYALVTGLARKVVEIVKQPIETKMIEEVKPPPPPEMEPPPPPPKMAVPPPPPPKMAVPPPPFIPPPEVAVATPPAQTIAAVSNVKPDNPVFTPPQAKAESGKGASRVGAVADFSTCTKPEYPRNSQRNEEQGTVILQFLIGADGTVKDAKLEKSSGYRDLDKAAQRGLSQCRFKPAIVDGHPAEAWSSVQYVWRLE
jgi:periplasmic protein TonB